MIVVDASVAIDVLLKTPGSEAAAERILAEREALHAPELIDVEIAQVVRRLVAHAGLSPSRGLEALEVFAVFPLTRHAHAPLLRRVWQLRENATAYDATYLALAEGLGATLVTRDKRLARVPRLHARVEVL